MENPLAYLEQRADDEWLIGYDSRQFNQYAEKLYLELVRFSKDGKLPQIILAEKNPVKFLAGFIAATAAGCPVFLCNPDWVKAEWQQVFELVQPDLIWGEQTLADYNSINFAIANQTPIKNRIMIPTGGSSGKIRFAIHTWETLLASVQGFTKYFDLNQVNSFCVLPLYHVSGLMQFMRSFTTGGKLAVIPFKSLESGQKPDIKQTDFFISLVPTQLQRLLNNHPDWLSEFKTVLLGGAPAWDELLTQAKRYHIPLALTYGMTETASQIVTMKPADFLNGNHSSGRVLPHAKVTIRTADGEILEANQIGIITIQAASLALGYYPDISFIKNQQDTTFFQPDDLGFFDEEGYLNIVGRISNKIITGGENVFPFEVEAAIMTTNLVKDVCVIGLPDKHWGQVVIAIYVPNNLQVSDEDLKTAIQEQLCNFKRPKYWISVENLPRNAQGKVNYRQIQQLAITWLQSRPNHSTNL
ncbi:MAG TPA: 2-succinylbenzoate--CoA ligase [Leptolyngbyaceae cyanobacterium]